MQLNNPLQMNDWEIKKFLKVILAIQLTVWGVLGLDAIGLQIPIIRQLIGFIYLTFVPGILILRILKLHKLDNIETLLYTVGLSIAILMFTGFFMNTFLPILSISKPISEISLIITISSVVLVLCYVSYRMDRGFSDPSSIKVKDILSPSVLSLCLIPFLAIFGAYSMNCYRNNSISVILIIIIALIVVSIGFDKFIPNNLYPLSVFVISISLLYNNSLISMYLWGCDIQHEFYLSNLVMENLYWDSTIPTNTNAMLSIVMLAPIFSKICGMSLTWVFKIIYPLLFSLVPLGLYRVFQKQTNDKIAFLACFFFVSVFMFYTEMLALARQQIAELFLVLLILLMIDKDVNRMKRAGLLIIFAFSLTVSHYGLSYVFMVALIATWGLLFLNIWRKNPDNTMKITIMPTFVLLYITFTIAWYMYVSSSAPFNAIVRIGDHIASSIFTDFLNPEAAQGLDIVLGEAESSMREVTKYLHLIAQFFIGVGILTLLFKRDGMKFGKEYAAFSYVNFIICFAGIALPFFASQLNTSRLYQITLIFLAPFCVIGAISFFKMISKIVKVFWTNKHTQGVLTILSVFLTIFFLFNSGLVYEIAGEEQNSVSLNNTFYPFIYTEGENLAGHWICHNMATGHKIYADASGGNFLYSIYGHNIYQLTMFEEYIYIPYGEYAFIGKLNIEQHKFYVHTRSGLMYVDGKYLKIRNSKKIYDNGSGQILLV